MQQRHVLVADDEPHIGRIIKMKLEQGPFRVTLAYDGQEALDVLARIRSSDRLKHLPCIILTAAGQEAQHQKAMELGATEFLTKPFSPKKLYARTAELAGLTQDEQGSEQA